MDVIFLLIGLLYIKTGFDENGIIKKEDKVFRWGGEEILAIVSADCVLRRVLHGQKR